MITICLVCRTCGGENNLWGAQRFITAPVPMTLHLKGAQCFDCAGLREWARNVLRSRGEWVDPPEWR